MTNPNEYSSPKTREPLSPHVPMTADDIGAYWVEHAPQATIDQTVIARLFGAFPGFPLPDDDECKAPKKRRRRK